jgi:PTS system sucrose-specific IIC component
MMVVLLGVSTNGIGAAGLSALPLIADGKYLAIHHLMAGCAAAFADLHRRQNPRLR